jgi:hypothetical protein
MTEQPRLEVLPTPGESITVGGYGSAASPADMARAQLIATTTRPTLAEAHAAVQVAVGRVRSVLTGAGVEAGAVISHGSSAQADYDYDDGGRHSGYRAEHPLGINLYDLATADRVLGEAVAAGGNDVRLDVVTYHLRDDTALRVRAREAAWADAVQRASHLAGLAGRALGPVRHLREGGVPDLPEHQQEAAMTNIIESGVTIHQGQVGLRVVVFGVWELV